MPNLRTWIDRHADLFLHWLAIALALLLAALVLGFTLWLAYQDALASALEHHP